MRVTYVDTLSGVFELRPGRRAVLWRKGVRTPHDYPKCEIECYAQQGQWEIIGATEARLLIAAQKRAAKKSTT